MPRTSAVEAARTARRVLDTARVQFARKGFAAVSVEDIAAGAGVTRGAVYHHYGDKQGLFRAVALRAHADVAADVALRAIEEDTPADQLRAGCQAFIDAITSSETARLLLVDGPSVLGWSEWREMDGSTSGRELREGLRALDHGQDVEALAQLLSGAMNEAALWLLDRPEDASARERVGRSLDLLLRAVTSEEERSE